MGYAPISPVFEAFALRRRPELKPRKQLRKLLFFDARYRNIHLVGHNDIAAVAAYIVPDLVHINQKLFVNTEKVAACKQINLLLFYAYFSAARSIVRRNSSGLTGWSRQSNALYRKAFTAN